jgi:hypothetical protein
MSNQKEPPSLLEALTDLKEGHHPLAMSILAEMEIMRQVEAHLSQTTDKLDDQALQGLHKRISDEVVSAVHEVVSTGRHTHTRTVARGNVMLPGQVLNPGDSLSGGNFWFVFGRPSAPFPAGSRMTNQADMAIQLQDGNLSLHYLIKDPTTRTVTGRLIWESKTPLSPAGVCVLEEDGNLVIYDPDGNPIWMTGTWGHPGSQLIVHQEGYVMIERPASQPPGPIIPPITVWSTHRLLATTLLKHSGAARISYDAPECNHAVPEGFKILGGGAAVDLVQPGNYFLTASYPKDARTWVGGAKPIASSPGTTIKVFPIAIYDPEDELDVRIFSEVMIYQPPSPFAAATVTVPGDYILTGGGAQASQGFLMASFPTGPKSWQAIFGDPTPPAPTPSATTPNSSLTVYAIGIKPSNRAQQSTRELFERKMFETKTLAYEGDSDGSPSAEISIPSGYVLTGGGALMNVPDQRFVFLQESFPAGNKWKVRAKDIQGACTILAWAIMARVGSGTLFQPPG